MTKQLSISPTMTANQLTQNKETVHQFYQTIYKGEIDKAFALYATPNMEWTVASPNSPETTAVLPWVAVIHRGAEGFKQLNEQLFGSVDVISFEDQDYFAEGDTVIVFGHLQFRAKSTGKLMETDWVVRLTMQDSKIARGQFFENTFAIASAFRHTGSWDIENVGSRPIVP